MEKKKSVISKVFGCVNKVENVILAIMVVGMLVTILLQIIGRVIGHPSHGQKKPAVTCFMDDVCGFGIRI